MKQRIKYWKFKCEICEYETNYYYIPEDFNVMDIIEIKELNKLYLLDMGNKLNNRIWDTIYKLVFEVYGENEKRILHRYTHSDKAFRDLVAETFEKYCVCRDGKITIPRRIYKCPFCGNKNLHITGHEIIPTQDLEFLICKDQEKISDEEITKSIKENKLFSKLIKLIKKAIEIYEQDMLFYNMTK